MDETTAVLWDALPRLGRWLRALSLSGGGGNLAAWAIVLALTALPALGLLWRRRCVWDWLLALASGEIFVGLYFLVNPTLLGMPLDGASAAVLWALAALGSAAAALLAWAALRWLGHLDRAEAPGRTLERLLVVAGEVLGGLAAAARVGRLMVKIQSVAAGNTASQGAELAVTYLTLIVLTVADLIPVLMGCELLIRSGKLARALEADPFGEETVALAERLSGKCARTAGAAVLVCAGGNLLQMLLFPALYATYFTMTFPLDTVLLSAALGLLCRYFRQAKAVSDDNGTII